MDKMDFIELSGRIEGLAQAYLVLGAELDGAGLVEAQLLQAMLRRRSDALTPLPSTPAAQRMMTGLAEPLLRLHMHRRSSRLSTQSPFRHAQAG